MRSLLIPGNKLGYCNHTGMICLCLNLSSSRMPVIGDCIWNRCYLIAGNWSYGRYYHSQDINDPRCRLSYAEPALNPSTEISDVESKATLNCVGIEVRNYSWFLDYCLPMTFLTLHIRVLRVKDALRLFAPTAFDPLAHPWCTSSINGRWIRYTDSQWLYIRRASTIHSALATLLPSRTSRRLEDHNKPFRAHNADFYQAGYRSRGNSS